MKEEKKDNSEESSPYESFIKFLLENKLIFVCNSKDKIKEIKDSLSECGINEISDLEKVYKDKIQKVNQLIDKFYLYANAFFQELLKINNFSFLFGAGTSIPFGSKSIRDVSNLEIQLKEELQELYLQLENIFLETSEKKDFESFLCYLYNIKNLISYQGKAFDFRIAHLENIDYLIQAIKKVFVEKACKPPYPNKIVKGYPKNNPFKIHQEIIRKVLVRSFPLRRPNIFTLNYDLMFEIAMDKMGIVYVDGFLGTTERIFKPESYNFDFYYPATTTEGKVNRLERVIHLYKLHGSIDWIRTHRTPFNVMGIVKKSPDFLNPDDFSDLLIYPTPMKEEETIGFPYSEIFRRFANIIQQPQSVLITLGYSFGDEHINKIIYEAFSIPSFNLVIIGYTKEIIDEIKNKIDGDDERITFLGGEMLGDFKNFVDRIFPSVPQMELEEKILRTLKQLFPDEIEPKATISHGEENEG